MPVNRLGQGALTGIFMLVVFAATSFAQSSVSAPRYSPHEVIVIGRPVTPTGGSLSGVPPFAIRDLAANAGVTALSARELMEGRAAEAAFPGGAWVLTLADGEDPLTAASKIGEDPAVAYAGPNHLIPIGDPIDEQAIQLPFTSPSADSTNDPLFENQFGMPLARIPEVWGITQGEGMLIAIIDTGVKLDHPDLAGQIAINAVEAAGLAGVDDDKNGFIDDIMGYDFVDAPDLPGVGDSRGRDPDPSDDFGHGTQVAGVACAERNNGIGIAGVAPKAKILAIRAGFRTGLPFLSAVLQEDDAAAGIIYAADRGAQILNLSFGSTADAPLIGTAVQYARDRGALVVVSAGNTRIDGAYYPAGYPGMLVVGASDQEDRRTAFSTYGQDLDLLALGISVLTTELDGGYGFSAGTSFSSPMVAGVAALLWSTVPEWSADQIAWQIRLASRRSGGGWNPQQGWGLVDAPSVLSVTGPPPLIQVESVRVENATLEINGTLTDPDLVRWSLSAITEAAAVAGDLSEEIILVEHSTRQVVRERLATFTPPSGSTEWVIRLVASVIGLPQFEERSRFSVPSAVGGITGLELELQGAKDGWDVAVWWSSPETQQGGARLIGPGIDTQFALEPSRGRTHGVRLPGPIPGGTWSVEVLGRTGSDDPFQVLATVPVEVPSPRVEITATSGNPLPQGTPMQKVVNWDQDAFLEILVEDPPSNDLYGRVIHYEILANGDAVEIGNSSGVFWGIPVDAADANGNGRPELLVFRLDEWSIREDHENRGFFTNLLHSESPAESLPLGFVDTGGGIRFLAVAGSSLHLYRSDDPGGYTRISEAPAGEVRLLNRFAAGDFNGDGGIEIVVVNENGELNVFEVDAQTVTLRETIVPPRPLAAPALAISAFGGSHDLITVEQDPATPEEEGDLQRAAARVRRWRHDGSTLKPIGSMALAGVHSTSDFQFILSGANVFLRRDRDVDVLSTTGGGLTWGGRVHSAELNPVNGMVLAAVGTPSVPMLWLGNDDGDEGERVFLTPSAAPDVGSMLEVMEATAVPGGVAVAVGWEPDACSSADSLSRTGDMRGTYGIPVSLRTAVDTVSQGEQVTFRLGSASCTERVLALTGRDPAPLLPGWDTGRVILPIRPPLRKTPSGSVIPPRDVLLVYDGIERRPIAVHVLGEGTGLLIQMPGADPDSLVVMGAWHSDGYPVGGSYRAAMAIPEAPAISVPPVIAEVEYRSSESVIAVAMSGNPPACDYQFRIEALNLNWSSGLDDPGWPAFNLSVGSPLAPGTYTLELVGDCLPDPAEGLGTSRSFVVGFLAYPNPLRSGAELVLENLEPGSRIQILDVSGRERLSWVVDATLDRRRLDLAPGLYFLRVESPGGTLTGLQKLGVLR